MTPGDTNKHLIGLLTGMRMRLVGLLIWVAKGDQCRTPSCVTFLSDTSGGRSETWLGSKCA